MPERRLPLPRKHNTMLNPELIPNHYELVGKRRLGQTDLKVRPSLIDTSNATKTSNLGTLDYAHIRIPLPKKLSKSGVFPTAPNQPIPEAYFLMRRSVDGYVSGTGMFKSAFPWATKEEEHSEKDYFKQLEGTDQEEIGGSIWITAQAALEIAEEYRLAPYVKALLDNEDVTIEYSTAANPKPITSPPRFTIPDLPPHTMSTRKRQSSREVSMPREMRSSSPVKSTPASVSSRPKATPRTKKMKKDKQRHLEERAATPASQAESIDELDENIVAKRHPASLANGNADDNAEDGEGETNLSATQAEEDEPLPTNTVRVSVQSEVQDDGELQTTHTTVKVEVPANSPDLALPTDTEGVVGVAKEIIENMKHMQDAQVEVNMQKSLPSTATSTSKKSLKRSRDEYEDDLEGPEEVIEEIVDVDEEGVEGVNEKEREEARRDHRPAKRVRIMVPAEEYRKEKVRGRALLSLGGAFAVGLLLPALSNFFA